MKQFIQLTIAVLLAFTFRAEAQTAHDFIKEGIGLNNANNYAGAIEKYKAALALEPDNAVANYQIAFSLNASGKGLEGLPYLQKAVQPGASAAVVSSAYGLMGGIYDKAGQPQKAIESYQLGLKTDTNSYTLLYGLGLAYFRNYQYINAEQSAVAAIRLKPDEPAPMRLYALVTFHQDKRAAALLGLCSFLWLDPTGIHSDEANENLQHILQGGTLKPESGAPRAPQPNANNIALNQAITKSVAEDSKQHFTTASEEFTAKLRAIFIAIGEQAEHQHGNDAFFNQLAASYAQLARSPNMRTFGHVIRQRVDKASVAWVAAHPQEVAALETWKNSAIHGR